MKRKSRGIFAGPSGTRKSVDYARAMEPAPMSAERRVSEAWVPERVRIALAARDESEVDPSHNEEQQW